MKIASIIIAALALSLMGIGLVKISHLKFKNQRVPALAAGSSFIDTKTLAIDFSKSKNAVEAAKLVLASDKKSVSKAELTQFDAVASSLPKRETRKYVEFPMQNIEKVLPVVFGLLQYELSAQEAENFIKEAKTCSKGVAVLKVDPISTAKFAKDNTFEFGYQVIVVNCKNSNAVEYLALTSVRTGKIAPEIKKKAVEECTKDFLGFKKCVTVEKPFEVPRTVDSVLKALITKVMVNKVVEVCEQQNRPQA
jgi:hypothetical protein